jgi:transposase
MPAPHPPEFRRRAVELAREVDGDGKRVRPVARLARDLKISGRVCGTGWPRPTSTRGPRLV